MLKFYFRRYKHVLLTYSIKASIFHGLSNTLNNYRSILNFIIQNDNIILENLHSRNRSVTNKGLDMFLRIKLQKIQTMTTWMPHNWSFRIQYQAVELFIRNSDLLTTERNAKRPCSIGRVNLKNILTTFG